MKKAYFSNCSRCGEKSLENLKTYSHCVNCLFVSDSYSDFESRYFKANRAAKDCDVQIAQPSQKENNKAA